ncbi:MAG: hypothetical protein BJ554DRAFT_1121, partial [Olpidium bornovanus]
GSPAASAVVRIVPLAPGAGIPVPTEPSTVVVAMWWRTSRLQPTQSLQGSTAMADAGERVFVYEDGSAEAFLPDHGLVVKLSPSGATFVAEPFGTGRRAGGGGQPQPAAAAPVKQRTEFATRAYVDAVRKALSIATVRWPAFSDILEEESGRVQAVVGAAEAAVCSLSVSETCGRWCFCERRSEFPPFDVNPALYAARAGPRGLLRCHQCRAVALMSLDRKSLAVLSPGGALLHVIWPCEIRCPPDIPGRAKAAPTSTEPTATARYAWVRQVYSVETCPNSWRHPLAVVQGCLRAASPESVRRATTRTAGAAIATRLPYLNPRKLAASDAANALFPQRTSAEDSLPISVLWTPRAVFRRVNRYGPGGRVPPDSDAPADFEAITTPTGVVVRSVEDMRKLVICNVPARLDHEQRDVQADRAGRTPYL